MAHCENLCERSTRISRDIVSHERAVVGSTRHGEIKRLFGKTEGSTADLEAGNELQIQVSGSESSKRRLVLSL